MNNVRRIKMMDYDKEVDIREAMKHSIASVSRNAESLDLFFVHVFYKDSFVDEIQQSVAFFTDRFDAEKYMTIKHEELSKFTKYYINSNLGMWNREYIENGLAEYIDTYYR